MHTFHSDRSWSTGITRQQQRLLSTILFNWFLPEVQSVLRFMWVALHGRPSSMQTYTHANANPTPLPAHVSIVAQIRLLFFPAPLLLFCVWASGTSFGSLNKATANVHKHTHTHAYLCMYVYTSVNSRRTKDSCGKPLVKSTKRIICKQKCEKGK